MPSSSTCHSEPPSAGRSIELSMPVGAFAEFDVHPTCGMLSATGVIGMFDDARSFYEPERIDAQLLWFHHGWVEYRFPNRVRQGERIANLRLSMELCSEAPLHNEHWPSDISVAINGVDLGSWTSPGDFGDQRGAFTPEWWSTANTQFGLMKVWQVTDDGTFIDGVRLSEMSLRDLRIDGDDFVSVRVGVSPESDERRRRQHLRSRVRQLSPRHRAEHPLCRSRPR